MFGGILSKTRLLSACSSVNFNGLAGNDRCAALAVGPLLAGDDTDDGSTIMNYETFADEWQAAWNSHDLARILAHYRDDIRFSSRKAAALVGTGLVEGRAALEAYWSRALEAWPDLHFEIDRVFGGHGMMVIAYTNHRGVKAAEMLKFDAEGLVYEAAACRCD